jgi:hypothetical protein
MLTVASSTQRTVAWVFPYLYILSRNERVPRPNHLSQMLLLAGNWMRGFMRELLTASLVRHAMANWVFNLCFWINKAQISAICLLYFKCSGKAVEKKGHYGTTILRILLRLPFLNIHLCVLPSLASSTRKISYDGRQRQMQLWRYHDPGLVFSWRKQLCWVCVCTSKERRGSGELEN